MKPQRLDSLACGDKFSFVSNPGRVFWAIDASSLNYPDDKSAYIGADFVVRYLDGGAEVLYEEVGQLS